MGIIITDNIERECIDLISMFLDTNLIKERILQSYPNLSFEKQKSVPDSIRFYISQGLELYSVSNESIHTNPLTLFYSLNNFVKAIYLLQKPNLSISGSHGIEVKTTEIKSITSIGDTKIHFTRKGTFSNLTEITNDPINETTVVSLKDLFSLLPELREIFYLQYEEEPNTFLMQDKKEDIGQFKILFQTDDESKISSKNFSLMGNNGYHLYYGRNYEGLLGNLILTQNSWGKDKEVTYLDSFGNKYCTTGINIDDTYTKISKISILYICYYVFSMYVRYYPDKWIKVCNSKDIALISKLMVNSKYISLVEILSLLNNDTYTFSNKIPSIDKDIDYSDLLDKLLKEIELENRRCGRSILSDYI